MRSYYLVIGFLVGVFVTAAAGAWALERQSKASIVDLDKAERRIAPSEKADIRILAHGTQAFLGLLRMDAGAKVPEHRDASEEYIYVLEGHGHITLDGKRQAVSQGSTIYMPKNARVSFENGDREMLALQVFADPASAQKYNAWRVARASK